MTWLNNTEEPHRTKLIETIRDVTAKKIFLQVFLKITLGRVCQMRSYDRQGKIK